MFSSSNDPPSWLLSQPFRLEYFSFLEIFVDGAVAPIIPFLKSQDQLKELHIKVRGLDLLFDNLEVATSMRFKAKVICLVNFGRGYFYLPYLTAFLHTQKCSLQELELSSIDLGDTDVDSLMGLLLTKLTLSDCVFTAPGDSTVTNNSIQSLTINQETYEGIRGPVQQREIDDKDNRAINKILQSCQAVDSLKIANVNIQQQLSQTIASLSTLSNLNLTACSFIGGATLNYPNVKILTIKEIPDSVVSQLTTANPQIESIHYAEDSDSSDEDLFKSNSSFICH